MRVPTLLDLTTPGAYGHPHFWARAMSRRQFLGTAAAASGAALTSSLWMPELVSAAGGNATPRPIPEVLILPDGTVLSPFHVQIAGLPGMEPSAITDFNGVVGAALINGTGRGSADEDDDDDGTPLFFDTDMRIMQGEYISLSGKRRKGTFGFI
jgi:hypothetical protein